MKILFVAGLDPLLAQGHALHVRHLVEELAALGHEVDVIGRDDGGGLEWDPPGRLVRVPRIPLRLVRQIERELRTASLLRRWIREDRPDAVLARSEALAFAPLLLPSSVRLAVESNASLVAQQGERQGWRAWLAGRLEKALFLRAARIGVVAPSLRNLHAEHHGVEPDRLFVVRNGAFLPAPIDLSSIRAIRSRVGTTDDEFVLALAGSASQRIEFDWLVSAVESTPFARLWVMGEGELWQEWRGRVHRSSAAERIDFLGALPEAEAARHLQASQVVVAPYREGRIEQLGGDPLKVLSGMASGRPLLASGVPEDPPFDRIGAGCRLLGSQEGWTQAISDHAGQWVGAGRPLIDWPREGESPGRSWIRENRTWAHAAAIWDRELRSMLV